MTVFVDDMRASFGTMYLCHMIADTGDELRAMAELVGLRAKWIQHAGTPHEHFDIAISKRRLALKNGAVEITWRQCAAMCRRRAVLGELGDPLTAVDWWLGFRLDNGEGEDGLHVEC